ncbi:MAG: carbonic anhydrase [Acidobacteriaceae bacterium]
MSHNAQAIVVSCIDFRFRKALQKFFEEQLNIYSVDHKADAGGAKMIVEEGPVRDWILKNIEISVELHHVNQIILINHEDCGAYGGSAKFASHDEEIKFQELQLRHAVSVVRAKYPSKQVEAYLAVFDKNHEQNIVFKKIA